MNHRREARLLAMRVVVRAFGPDARHLLFLGGAALGIYARPEGSELRVTKDVDCLWTGGFAQQQLALQRLAMVLPPVKELACRYSVAGEGVVVDVMDPDGRNVGATNRWFAEAMKHPVVVDVGEGVHVSVVTPGYLFLTKLEAALGRAEFAEDEDVEDIVQLVVEQPAVFDELRERGHAADAANGLCRLLERYRCAVEDLVEWHVSTVDYRERDRVLAAFEGLLILRDTSGPGAP